MLGAETGPAPAVGAPDTDVGTGVAATGPAVVGARAGAAPVAGLGFGLARWAETLMVGSGWAFGSPTTGCAGAGSTTASGTAGVWAGACWGNANGNATTNAIPGNALDTFTPEDTSRRADMMLNRSSLYRRRAGRAFIDGRDCKISRYDVNDRSSYSARS
jgi:hypothetical protein